MVRSAIPLDDVFRSEYVTFLPKKAVASRRYLPASPRTLPPWPSNERWKYSLCLETRISSLVAVGAPINSHSLPHSFIHSARSPLLSLAPHFVSLFVQRRFNHLRDGDVCAVDGDGDGDGEGGRGPR